MVCEFPGCEKPAFRDGLCGAHTKQRTRGKSLTRIIETPPPFDRMLDAHGAILDAKETGHEDKAAILRFHKATIAWLLEHGWRRAPGDILVMAFYPVADAELDSDFSRSIEAFRRIAERWARGQGMRPPKRIRVAAPRTQLALWAA